MPEVAGRHGTRWRLAGGGRKPRIPGQPYARLVIGCWPCAQAGRHRTLAVFEMDAGDTTLWVVPRRVPGNAPASGWTAAVPRVRGTGDAARVKLICGIKAGRGGKDGGGCPHTPDVPVSWITAELAAAGAGRTRHALR